MCINAHTSPKIVKNDFLTILICWIYANYRNPTGHPQRSRDVKSSVASYPAAVKYSGLSRSRLYELLSERKIRSICLKSHKGAERGVRLLDRESIDTFMLALHSEVVSQCMKNREGMPHRASPLAASSRSLAFLLELRGARSAEEMIIGKRLAAQISTIIFSKL